MADANGWSGLYRATKVGPMILLDHVVIPKLIADAAIPYTKQIRKKKSVMS